MKRRNFIWQGGLVAAGLITGKAGSAIANSHEAYSTAFNNRNKLLLLLSPLKQEGNNLYMAGKLVNPSDWQTRVNRFKTSNRSFVLLHQQGNLEQFKASSAFNLFNREEKMAKNISPNMPLTTPLFSVVKNGNFQIGVIDLKNHAGPDKLQLEEISRIATHLKENLQCKMVVCISQLGYKTNETLDDYRLAAKTTGLDLIVGLKTHSKGPAGPLVVLNQQKQEVILHYQASHKLDISAVEWTFNERGNKTNIAFLS